LCKDVQLRIGILISGKLGGRSICRNLCCKNRSSSSDHGFLSATNRTIHIYTL